MRGRDFRAIVFCVISTAAFACVAWALLQRWLPVLGLIAAYDAWLLTRPRMMRVVRRLRGERLEWRSYYQE